MISDRQHSGAFTHCAFKRHSVITTSRAKERGKWRPKEHRRYAKDSSKTGVPHSLRSAHRTWRTPLRPPISAQTIFSPRQRLFSQARADSAASPAGRTATVRLKAKRNYGGQAGRAAHATAVHFDHVILSGVTAGNSTRGGAGKVSHRFNQEGRSISSN